MKLSMVARCIALLCIAAPFLVGAIDEIDREIAELALLSGTITAAVRENPESETPCAGCTDYRVFYKDKSSFAVVTRTPQQKCLIVFSDSNIVVRDWLENLDPGTSIICDKDEQECCKVRRGFKVAFTSNLFAGGKEEEVEQALRDCADTCINPDECVVMGGYSQGGASNQIAAIRFRDLNPYIIGLAPPQAIFEDCPLIDSDRTYGFINTHVNDKEDGLVYDIVPVLPGVGAKPLGKLFLISDDETGVAFLGQDKIPEEYIKGPLSVLVHLLTTDDVGYIAHMEDIVAAASGPMVRTTGFRNGSACNYDFECESDNCEENECS